MKKFTKTCIVAGAILTLGFGAHGQMSNVDRTTHSFADFSKGLVLHTDMMAVQASDNVYGQLFAGPTGGTVDQPVGMAVQFGTAVDGMFIDSGSTTVPLAAGAVDLRWDFWDMDTGATFDVAMTRASSPVFTVTTVDVGTPPIASFEPSNVTLQDVGMVPEPSTVALGIIGGLALLMRRRRS